MYAFKGTDEGVVGEFGCCWPETVARPEKAVHYSEVEESHSCSLFLYIFVSDLLFWGFFFPAVSLISE